MDDKYNFIKKDFSNRELNLYARFYETTKIYPKNLIVLHNFVFFFVDSENYFKAKSFLRRLQKFMAPYIILIIRKEETLIKMLFNLFPEPLIFHISSWLSKKIVVNILNLSLDQTKASIRYWNRYFKVVNQLFKDFVEFEAHPGVSIIINYKIVDVGMK